MTPLLASKTIEMPLSTKDYNMLNDLIQGYKLQPKVVVKYKNTDDILPLVLRYTNETIGGEIIYSLLYKVISSDFYIPLGVCIYDPDRNFLVKFEFNPSRNNLLRVGVSKIIDGEEKWEYDNYFWKNKIIYLKSPPSLKGSIWFSRPF